MQDSWDPYAQNTNLSLDPAANLWSSGSVQGVDFTSSSSPASRNEASSSPFGMNSNFYPTPSIAAVMDPNLSKQQPVLSENSPQAESDGAQHPGETFMGAGLAVPGGVPSWKSVFMNDRK